MTFAIIWLVSIQLILPAVLIFTLWRRTFHSKLEGYLQLSTTVLFIVWIFFSGRWDWLSYYLRFLWLVLLIPAGWQSWKKIRTVPFRSTYNLKKKIDMAVYLLLTLWFGVSNLFVIQSFLPQDPAIELSFPLKNGIYYVGHGGNHVQMNYHHAVLSQKYALDLSKLHPLGFRAKGLSPKNLQKYEIFGEPLHSPCSGQIVAARDQLPDRTPGVMPADPKTPEGNYVALKCDNKHAVIYLAHMKKGSIAVGKGDRVKKGQIIGSVGNSGNTSEPHLHIHAEKDGKGVPIRFDGRFLVRNSLIWK